MEADPYARIVEWYDLEHDALTEDVACYAGLIASLVGGRARVLEVGSGTGRTAAALALAGCQVTGIEPSAAMRAVCARRLAQLPQPVARRVTILAGSATDPTLRADQSFDAVLYGLNTFAHLATARERHEALDIARRHLAGGGPLLLDLDLLSIIRLRKSLGRVWWQGTWPLPAGGEVTHFMAAQEDDLPRVLRLRHFYDVTDSMGNLSRVTASMRLSVLRREQLERELAHAGFVINALYGSYDLAPYEEGAPRALFVASVPYETASGSVK
ncbi:MAG TPA: class I SAM-dependent methyltransferase [Ktedonobacterales bacterium]|nr:class I SAM-dependent methyltransferase [Ktedonobacterales bacterium]